MSSSQQQACGEPFASAAPGVGPESSLQPASELERAFSRLPERMRAALQPSVEAVIQGKEAEVDLATTAISILRFLKALEESHRVALAGPPPEEKGAQTPEPSTEAVTEQKGDA